jgi:uncharacterized protein YdaU (DUF1376 family)
MNPAQEGAYIRLLCYAWADPDCSLPDDDAALAQLSRLGDEWFNGSSSVLRQCFIAHPKVTGRLLNVRLVESRKYANAWSAKSSIGGINSAKAKASKRQRGSTTLQPQANQLVEHWCNSSSSSSSSSSNKREEEGLTPSATLQAGGFSVQEVLAAWNQIPGTKAVELGNLSPGRGIHKRITVLTVQHKHDAREWWGSVFDAVKAQGQFLFSGTNQKQWVATLQWVLGPENLAKVLERRYEPQKPPQPPCSVNTVRPSRPREVVL